MCPYTFVRFANGKGKRKWREIVFIIIKHVNGRERGSICPFSFPEIRKCGFVGPEMDVLPLQLTRKMLVIADSTLDENECALKKHLPFGRVELKSARMFVRVIRFLFRNSKCPGKHFDGMCNEKTKNNRTIKNHELEHNRFVLVTIKAKLTRFL